MLCFCSVGHLQLPCSPNSFPVRAPSLETRGFRSGLGRCDCHKLSRKENRGGPSPHCGHSDLQWSHLRCQGLWELVWSKTTHHADNEAYLQMDNLLLLPFGPLPSYFPSHNLGEARRNVLHGGGGGLGGVSLLSGFR